MESGKITQAALKAYRIQKARDTGNHTLISKGNVIHYITGTRQRKSHKAAQRSGKQASWRFFRTAQKWAKQRRILIYINTK